MILLQKLTSSRKVAAGVVSALAIVLVHLSGMDEATAASMADYAVKLGLGYIASQAVVDAAGARNGGGVG